MAILGALTSIVVAVLSLAVLALYLDGRGKQKARDAWERATERRIEAHDRAIATLDRAVALLVLADARPTAPHLPAALRVVAMAPPPVAARIRSAEEFDAAALPMLFRLAQIPAPRPARRPLLLPERLAHVDLDAGEIEIAHVDLDADEIEALWPSWEALYTHHSGAVLRALSRLGAGPQDREDLLHEVFVIAGERLPTYDPSRGDPPAWLAGIARRVLRGWRDQHRRREGREVSFPSGALERMAWQEADQTAPREARDRAALLDALLAEVEPARRAVVVKHEIDGLTMAETGRALGVRLSTVDSRLKLGREQLTAAAKRHRAREIHGARSGRRPR